MASTRVVGLDIGTTMVRAAQLEFGSGRPAGKSQPTLAKYAQVPLPLGAVRDGDVADQPAVSQAIKQLWTVGKFDSKEVVIGVGNPRVVVRDLDLPWLPLPQLKASLPFQVQETLPMQPGEALLDYYPTAEYEGEAGRMVAGILVAAPRDTVAASILAVEGAGLRTSMVDLNAFAILRALARGELAQRTVAFVDIGAKVTNVVITARGIPRLVRILKGGGQDVTEAVASALSVAVPEAETLKRQIGIGFQVNPELAPAAESVAAVTRNLLESVRNTFTFYGTNNPGAGVELIVLTGGGSHLPGLGQYLASASRLPATIGDPVSMLRIGKTVNRETFAGAESLTTLAVGLAFGVAQ